MNIFDTLLFQPIFNLIVVFYNLLGSNLGFAIIAIALVSRIILIPLTRRQMLMAEKSREFTEKSNEIKKKFKKNKEKQQQELIKLQQEYLPAQLGGCLPLIFQLILFIFIYRAIDEIVRNGVEGFNQIAYSFMPTFAEDYILNSNFLNILDLKLGAAQISGFPQIIPYIALVLLVGATQFFSTRLLTARSAAKRAENKKEGKKKKKKSADEPEDFGEIMQRSTQQAAMIMPIFFMFISYSLPSGLGIYLITTNLFVILQTLITTKVSKNNLLNKQNDTKS